jgi:LPS O-antigen subunit length determinant protein (WzzB/FepE family)
MKNKTLIIIVIITATAAVLSLGIYQKRTHQINASLLQIEQLMYERPDSAWNLLKNKANIVHSRHRSIHNFIMNICAALTAYSFFENKPEALPVHVEKSNQLTLF